MKVKNMKTIASMNRYEILSLLLEDGFEIDEQDAAYISKTIQLAARTGCLVWTQEHIVSTLHERPLTLDRPRGQGEDNGMD